MQQEYKVIQPFEAAAPISGAKRQFGPGEIAARDIKQGGSTLTVGAEGAFSTYYLVDRSVFEDCCKWISRTAGSMEDRRQDNRSPAGTGPLANPAKIASLI